MSSSQHPQIIAAADPANAATVLHMKSGFVVMANSQFLPGYCLLLGFPQAGSLTELSIQRRNDYLCDMHLIGEAIENVCQPRRVNYAILGNKDPFLHAHIIPRYDWEEPDLQPQPIWRYPDEVWSDERYLFSVDKQATLRDDLRQELTQLMQKMEMGSSLDPTRYI